MKLTRIHSRYSFHKALIKASNNGTPYRHQKVLVCALHKGIYSSFPGDKTHLLNVKYQENYKRKHLNISAALMKTISMAVAQCILASVRKWNEESFT